MKWSSCTEDQFSEFIVGLNTDQMNACIQCIVFLHTQMHYVQQLGKRSECGDEWIRAPVFYVAQLLSCCCHPLFQSHIVVGTECHHLQEKPVLSSVFCREMNIHRCNLLFGSKAKLHLQCGHLILALVSANMEELMPSLYLCLLFALPLPVKTDNSGVLLLYNVK